MLKPAISLALALAVVLYGTPPAWAAGAQSVEIPPLEELIERTYVELFSLAPDLNVPKAEIDRYLRVLEGERDSEETRLNQQKRSIENDIDDAQKQLRDLNRRSERSPEIEQERHSLHCKIQQRRQQLQEIKLALEKGVGLAFDNKFAKLKILEEWPREYGEAQRKLADSRAAERKFGDFRDVGFRAGPFDEQVEDISRGREAIDELKRQNLLPPEVEDEVVVDYINRVAARIARHSDLQVPLNVTTLKSQEINAFALPGGFLFVNSQLILTAETEAELAGVLAHEIAHVAARHGNRLMGKANIAGIIFQVAQLAALILTGGVTSIATFYLLQYGFFGLGLVLNLSLLGVSRDYEIEADVLGTQYLWHAGYNVEGFIDFFGRMAQQEGYVTGLSWFRTHPPFYERMAETYREILFLPRQEDPIHTTAEFDQVRERLKRIAEEMEQEDREAPTLRRVYDCDGYDFSIPELGLQP